MRKFILSSILALYSYGSCAGDWPMFMGNSAHSGAAEAADVPRIRKLTLAWQHDFHSTVVASPVVSGEQLFVAAENGNLYALNWLNAEQLFAQHQQMHASMEKVKRLGAFIASPLWANQQLILMTANGHLLVFSPK